MIPENSCPHAHVQCLNEYEFIRKYVCEACGGIMMCQCDEAIGRELLPHQLIAGTEKETQARVPVTLGSQPGICRECRGLTPEAHPVASIHGRTSKIRRYYWREIWRREWEIFRDWAQSRGLSPTTAAREPGVREVRQEAAARALREIKELHARSPKYTFHEESQSSVLQRCQVPVEELKATYRGVSPDKVVQVRDGSDWVGIEEFVERHYGRNGWTVLFLQSSPLHVLFGVFMWLVIQDPTDRHIRTVGFGDRKAADENRPGELIWIQLPDDFGTSGYGRRRAEAVAKHLSSDMHDRDNLLWLFDYWLDHSEGLRNYLWAHRLKHVRAARRLVEVLPPMMICNILEYLLEDYWGRYCGWPDLLVWRNEEFFLAEVKSSSDKLSEDQKRWISDNYESLKTPFRLVRVHKAGVAA